jgi:hypothetical protein
MRRKVVGVPHYIIQYTAIACSHYVKAAEVKNILLCMKGSTGKAGLEWPRGFQEVKVPRFHDNGTGWW